MSGLKHGVLGLHLYCMLMQGGNRAFLNPLVLTNPGVLFCFLSAGSKQYSASIAFTLALFSHLVNHVNIRLQAELEEGESQVPPLHTDNTGERKFQSPYIKKKNTPRSVH